MSATKAKPENLLLNLACNVAIPTAIMSWASGPRALGPKWGLLVALLFPVGYGLFDFARRRRFNFISAIGFVSILITGGLGLYQLDGFWFAVKDGALPALIGIAMLVSLRAKEPLVMELLYNPQMIDVERVEAALTERKHHDGFRRLLHSASYTIASAMLVSAALNYFFARAIIQSPPDTEAFNQELAKMHWVSLLGLSIPTMGMLMLALWRLFKGISSLTGLTLDEILRQPPAKDASAATVPKDGGPASGAPG